MQHGAQRRRVDDGGSLDDAADLSDRGSGSLHGKLRRDLAPLRMSQQQHARRIVEPILGRGANPGARQEAQQLITGGDQVGAARQLRVAAVQQQLARHATTAASLHLGDATKQRLHGVGHARASALDILLPGASPELLGEFRQPVGRGRVGSQRRLATGV